ncbi:chromate transporter, chromate ion transporter (CHR) family [Sulfuricurvum kujiense DSM 16994]|uniref:Chromate transporter, chromate ion transporter (CHR) family n=1 Tax=Sulfuricurvum kujiense (strain ATCC BAA-921 / DSM 16994 / JCM 11577 / YK-1) TaxID=709032 RepID=E4TZJ6_SULKY|nr:chromate efflux transporter [Sulfuricurvum kujiense]ADR33084.1 chromate transporter, chromate ion transporter (CHR) family [Sulfuricurvum kujiense DSM 16994]
MKIWELFWRFLLLGLVSFGGPAAHIGYFRTTFVDKLRWLDNASYARLVALSQFLPGPGSSQVGFAIGIERAGLLGGIAAFIGFTIPSFIFMATLAIVPFEPTPIFTGMIHGLKLFAVIVVADAVLSMYRSFCTSTAASAIAIASAASLWLFPSLSTQMILLIISAVIGLMFLHIPIATSAVPIRISYIPLILFLALFILVPFFVDVSKWIALFNTFFQSGALVFGGGHVVLPLLQHALGDSITTERFLFGYAAAQAVPGPMFSLAAFLGTDLSPSSPLLGALVATLSIFLPGFLLLLGLYRGWEILAQRPRIAAVAAGLNAAVVGILLAALYNPVFTSGVTSTIDMALVVTGFFLLRMLKIPVVGLLPIFALSGVIISVKFV